MDVMISKYKHKELHWIDLEEPTTEEVFYVLDEYSIPSFIKEKINLEKIEDEINLDHNIIFASFDFSQISSIKESMSKIIFIACENFIITIHTKPIKALGEFLKEMELDVMTREKEKIKDNKLLFAHLLKSLYVNSHKQLIENEFQIIDFKKQIIKNNKKIKSLTALTIILSIVFVILFLYAIIHF